MKVLIFGNVGSGKTTLIKSLESMFSFEIISVDDFRRKYGDGSEKQELIAREFFLQAIKPNENQFIECLGIGVVADKLIELLYLTHETIICVILICSCETCLNRLSTRNWDIPFPSPIGEVNSLIVRTAEKIGNNRIENLLGERVNTIIVRRNNEQFIDHEKIYSELITLIQNYL